MKQKVISVFLAVCLLATLLTAVPLSAQAAQPTGEAVGATSGKTGEVNWKLNGTELTISGYGAMADYNYEYKDKTPWGYDITSVNILPGVTRIGRYAFKFAENLTSVTVGNSVESIGRSAFSQCKSIKELYLPDSVTVLEDSVFWYCGGLETIRMPAHLDYFGYEMFNACRSLKSLDIPEGVTDIPSKTVFWCSSLEHINLPSTLKRLDFEAFCACYSLKELTLPERVQTIEKEAFAYCYDLESVNIPAGNTVIPDSTFLNCRSLTEIELPESVQSIGAGAFQNCAALTSVNIPDGIPAIEDNAFKGCASLTELTVPSSVTRIGASAFDGCTNLHTIGFADFADALQHAEVGTRAFHDTAWFRAQPVGIYYIGDAVYGCNATAPAAFAIRNGATSILDGAFMGCDALTGIEIPNSITAISLNAFKDCTALKSIELPDTVTDIAGEAFSGCTQMKKAVLSGNIAANAFKGCTSLAEVSVREGAQTVGESAFSGCTALEKVRLADSITTIERYTFKDCTSLTRLVLPNQLTQAVGGTFQNCTALEAVLFTSADTDVSFWYIDKSNKGDYTFADCPDVVIYAPADSLAKSYADKFKRSFVISDTSGDCTWTLENGVLTLAGSGKTADYTDALPSVWSAFNGYFIGESDSISRVEIDDGVTSVGERVFKNVSTLESVSLPESVNRIGFEALDGTAWLNAQPEGIVYCGNVLYTYQGVVPEVVGVRQDISGIADGAFSGSQALKRFIVPDGVQCIGANAFADCPELSVAVVPASVTEIGSGAFTNSPNLTIYCDNDSVAHNYAKKNKLSYALRGVYQGLNWMLVGGKLTVYGDGSIPKRTLLVTLPWGRDMTEVILGTGITSVGENVFSECNNLKKIVIQSPDTTVNYNSFPTTIALFPQKKYDLYCFAESKADKTIEGNSLFKKAAERHYLGEKGDANIDGVVDINDATFLQIGLAEFDNLPLSLDNENVKTMGDLNGDGVLNVRDITEIQRYLAEIRDAE